MSAFLAGLFKTPKAVIGMLHAPPLPGSPRCRGPFDRLCQVVLNDAAALAQGGVDGFLLENFGDTPFFPGRVPAVTVSCMTALAVAVRYRFPEIPLGINVLRNDGQSALAIAVAAGAQFIRVNVLCGARVTDQGLLQGLAHELLRDRAAADADQIKIFADVDVKHSAPLALRPIEQETEEFVSRGGADAIIVSGSGTGRAADRRLAEFAKAAAGDAAVFIGSGITADSVNHYVGVSDGFIVGSWLKQGGLAANPVELSRVVALMAALGR